MNKKILIPTFAAILATSPVHAAVAVFLDPVHYKDSQAKANVPQVRLAGYSPLTEAILLGSAPNPAAAHQVAETSMELAHEHSPFGQQTEGSPFEACQNYQMEQLGIALAERGSPLKKYLKDYTKTFGGRVQLATLVQLNSWSSMTINTEGLVHPELNIVEDGHDGVGLNFTPVLEAATTFQSKTPKMSCKILSAEEITQISSTQLAILKAKHLKKSKSPDLFKMKDLMSVVSSTIQTVPKFGYPVSMDLQMEKISTNSSVKTEDASTSANTQTSVLASATTDAN